MEGVRKKALRDGVGKGTVQGDPLSNPDTVHSTKAKPNLICTAEFQLQAKLYLSFILKKGNYQVHINVIRNNEIKIRKSMSKFIESSFLCRRPVLSASCSL